ncbi:hypothetical protein M758_3G111900 [Ceratodon purpureus]|uniref:Uncharacterized protein n=1 Tax=Ceratodon purpureus TaxID=3225 RepID=A0A8T0IJV5_CERPU|nr:hypothetical protein KC19_3G110000 [Ceratodon purpureus]KAG0622618.1 hypothetical protein M758_3G111900 [Ceratodon purpureus]
MRMRSERDDGGMRLRLLLVLLLMMVVQARREWRGFGGMEGVAGGWFCGGDGKLLERRCIGGVYGVTVW